jgi:sugar lactone lactonase YvrE
VSDDLHPIDSGYAEDDRPQRLRSALIGILVVLVLLLAGLSYFVVRIMTPLGSTSAGRSTPTGLEWVRSIYGYGPSPTQQFYRPVDVAVGPGGKIWGTDTTRNRILGFNPDGTLSSQVDFGVAATGAGRIQRMEGVATDEAGNLFVADFGADKVAVFAPDGTFIREWPVPVPSDIAVAGGRVVVGSAPGVSVFTTDGKLLSVWGKRGNGPNEFDGAHGVAIAADGTVYVADTLNRRVKAYGRDGTLLWIWPAALSTAPKPGIVPKEGPGGLQVPSSITIDGSGRLVLVDTFGFDIVVLKPTSKGATLVGRFGEQGVDDGRFTYPFGIAYDVERDWFVIADTTNDRLQIVRLPGSTTAPTIAALRRSMTGPWSVCAVPLGLLLAAVIIWTLIRRWRRHPPGAPEHEADADDHEDADDE